MPVMNLTEKEVALVEESRRKELETMARIEKQRNCKHDWSYRGEWRGRSHYECYLCGDFKSDD